MGIYAEVMRAGVGIGNVLVAIFEIYGPAFREEISDADTDIEVKIKILASDVMVDIGGGQAGACLRKGNNPGALRDKIITAPKSDAGDITTGALEYCAAESFAGEFKIAAPPSGAAHVAYHVSQLHLGDGVVDRWPAFDS